MKDSEIDALKKGDTFLYGNRRTPRKVIEVCTRPYRGWGRERLVMVKVKKLQSSRYPSTETYVDRWFLRTHCSLPVEQHWIVRRLRT